MSAFYQTFTSLRSNEPDPTSLFNQLRGLDVTAGVQHEIGSTVYTIKKSTVWTAPQMVVVQNIIDTAPDRSPQLTAQAIIDNMPIFEKAILLTILDQINLIRSKLVPPLGAITPGQVIQAVRDKAGTL